MDERDARRAPDARYELKSFAVDAERQNIAAYAGFHGTHSGDGGPVPPTGKSARHRLRLRDGFSAASKIRHDERLGASPARLDELEVEQEIGLRGSTKRSPAQTRAL